MTDDKVRENQLRRMAQRQGLVLIKSRRRDPRAIDYGQYWLADANSNFLHKGPYNDGFADLDQVEAFLSEEEPSVRAATEENRTMTDAQRERIIAAWNAWKDAEAAYRTESARYVSAGWLNDGPLPPPEKALTHEALHELNRLRDTAKAAQEAYQATLAR